MFTQYLEYPAFFLDPNRGVLINANPHNLRVVGNGGHKPSESGPLGEVLVNNGVIHKVKSCAHLHNRLILSIYRRHNHMAAHDGGSRTGSGNHEAFLQPQILQCRIEQGSSQNACKSNLVPACDE
ncbi:hypothetical protein D3C81_1663160 [compost metagenome]